MRRMLLCFVVAASMTGCRRSPAVGGPLRALALDPSKLPTECQLSWVSRPLPLSTKTEGDRKYFELLAGFWTGPGKPLLLSEVDAGISNTYASPADQYAVVAFSVFFKKLEAAESFRRLLDERFSKDPSRYWIHQAGKVVTAMSRHVSVDERCVAPLREHLAKVGDAV